MRTHISINYTVDTKSSNPYENEIKALEVKADHMMALFRVLERIDLDRIDFEVDTNNTPTIDQVSMWLNHLGSLGGYICDDLYSNLARLSELIKAFEQEKKLPA